MNLRNTLKRLVFGPEQQTIPVLGRNDICWCGSGRKYKTCHLSADDRKRAAERNALGNVRQGGMF